MRVLKKKQGGKSANPARVTLFGSKKTIWRGKPHSSQYQAMIESNLKPLDARQYLHSLNVPWETAERISRMAEKFEIMRVRHPEKAHIFKIVVKNAKTKEVLARIAGDLDVLQLTRFSKINHLKIGKDANRSSSFLK